MSEKLPWQADSAGVTLLVKVAPRSAKNAIAGVVEGKLKIGLTAPPVDGAANEMLVEFLAKALNLRKSEILILSGHTSRQKRLLLRGITLEQFQSALNLS